MSLERLYPTKNEAEALAALVPANRSITLPAQNFLLQLVLFCQQEEVRSFLFDSDPFQLTYLPNPQIKKTAVTAVITSTRVENNATRCFSNHIRTVCFLAPVFTAGNLNFGFGVHEYVYNPAILWDTLNPGIFGRSMSRFVRDDKLGIMVTVLDVPEEDYSQVEFTQLINSTGQFHAVALFRRQQLRAVYESGTFDMANLTRALESFEVSYQTRDCPLCGAKQSCNCDLPRISQRHPLDNTAFYANMTRRLGTFQGLADVILYQNGLPVHSTSCGTRFTIAGGIDVNLIERLQKWAICESAVSDDPRQSLISFHHAKTRAGLLQNPLDINDDQTAMQDGLSFPEIDNDWYENPNDEQVFVTAEVLEDAPSNLPQSSESLSRDIMEDVSDASQEAIPAAARESTTPEGRTSSSGSRNASTGLIKSESDDRELVKKLRAELRKERNRASAQRSNLRKKAENDARKREIKTNKEKTALLRAREMMLRQENKRLRQQLTERSVVEQ